LGQGSLLGQGSTLSQLSKQVLPVCIYEAEASEDRADEVEPRPNRQSPTDKASLINAFSVRDCFGLPVVRIVKALRIPALAMTARRRDAMTIATNMSSLTGFLIADNYNNNPVIAREARPKQSVTINASNNYPIIAKSRQLKANKIHFQLSTFNFQLFSDCFAALAMTATGLAIKSDKSFKSYKNQSSDNPFSTK
jgi:hypothetical protein